MVPSPSRLRRKTENSCHVGIQQDRSFYGDQLHKMSDILIMLLICVELDKIPLLHKLKQLHKRLSVGFLMVENWFTQVGVRKSCAATNYVTVSIAVCKSVALPLIRLYTVKKFGLLQPYFGHLSCIPVVCVTHYKTSKQCFLIESKLNCS